MKRLYLFVALLSLAPFARGDDQTQAVQQALKDQGFYYGQVDGQGGPETDAALRRFQIRQGLDVTGKLDEQTLDSLHLGKGDDNAVHAVPPPPADSADSQPAPTPRSVQESDHDFLKRHPSTPAPAAPADDDTAAPPPSQAPQPPEPPAQAGEEQTSPDEYSQFFRRTPYESAPPVVQRSTVQRAQSRLAHEGFYRGVADGELGDSLNRAIVAYQRDADISPSGRLDMETLSEMDLLPKRHSVIRPFEPFAPPVDQRGVYRGIWIH